jgi:ABC-type dipeptide/oligopeptide/nickel transport system permease subunit
VGVVNSVASYWWLLVFPSVALATTLLSLNYLGDGLRDAVDPKARKASP